MQHVHDDLQDFRIHQNRTKYTPVAAYHSWTNFTNQTALLTRSPEFVHRLKRASAKEIIYRLRQQLTTHLLRHAIKIKKIPVRIPPIDACFMLDRSLLVKLSQCAWKVLNLYLTQAVPYDDAKAGAAVAVQSFGDFQNFHPHLHVLATDGCFYNDGAFMVCLSPKTADLVPPRRDSDIKCSKCLKLRVK